MSFFRCNGSGRMAQLARARQLLKSAMDLGMNNFGKGKCQGRGISFVKGWKPCIVSQRNGNKKVFLAQ